MDTLSLFDLGMPEVEEKKKEEKKAKAPKSSSQKVISEGVDIVRISNRLGHANPKITLEFYAHLMPNADNDIADIFRMAIQNARMELEKILRTNCGQMNN